MVGIIKMKTLSIITPVYNEEKYINQTVEKIIKADSSGLRKEIIVIDDGSTDKTKNKLKSKLKQLKVKNKNSKLLKNKNITAFKTKNFDFILIEKKRNQGKGAALKTGFLRSTGDIVLVQDGDLEYNPDDYPLLLEPFLDHNADVVYGSRFVTNRPHRVLYFWHYTANLFLTILSNIFTNLNLTDMETGYKVFKGQLIRKLAQKLESNCFGFEPEITARISKVKNIRIYEVGISYWGRTYQEGKKISWKDGLKSLLKIIKYNLFA